MSDNKPVKLAVLWHMHQPDYRESQSARMVLPWVRLHALKDYLDMPLLAAKYDQVKVTFNLVPSLLDQFELYLKGGTDPHLELTNINAEQLTDEERLKILNSFFSAPTDTMIKPYRRYFELFNKTKDNRSQKVLSALFSNDEMRDIQVWSNLAWVDPLFREEEPIQYLFEKQRHFTEEDKQSLVKWQFEHIAKIIPTYKKLFQQKKIDISFTPYYHPILPLLCDTNSAKEALPNIELPKKRFAHPEDAEYQIRMSVEKYESLFETKMKGMWPSEGSVSEETARLISQNEIRWIATDEEILHNSLKKSKMSVSENHPHQLFSYNGLKIFFRDHALSDRVGFVYSGMDPDKAVEDFMEHLYEFQEKYSDELDEVVIPVILDGENAWEYFENDGYEFLDALYKRLSNDPRVQTVGMSEFAETATAKELSALFAGSWINHNFKIWIGHHEDNRAWDLLTTARECLVEFEKNNPAFDKSILQKARQQIYIAEGSDWCWWYGDEHRGEHNKQFDQIFRKHVSAVYDLLGIELPAEFLKPIYRDDAVFKAVMPDDIVTPIIDGRLTHFYEWAQSGYFDNSDSGGAMHSVSKMIRKINFVYDHNRFYLRIDFNPVKFRHTEDLKAVLHIYKPTKFNIEIAFGKYDTVSDETVEYAFKEILEVGIDRMKLFPEGFGQLHFSLSLFDGEKKLETMPETEPIVLDMPPKNQEVFWLT